MIKKPVFILVALLLPLIQSFQPKESQPVKPKNIILMIGDGMGLSQISAALIANGNKLHMEKFRHIGLVKTFSGDELVTKSAAAATAFATGTKTKNGYVGVNMGRKPLQSILEIAHQKQLATGLVATAYIQHATPAAFYAHVTDRYNYDAISLDLLNGTVDVAVGGGRKFLEDRKDGLVITDSLEKMGYEFFTSLSKAEKKSETERVFVIANADHIPAMHAGRGKFLVKGTEFAIDKLKKNENGFFLMVEGSQIDWGGHANDKEYIINEVIDFDKTIGRVLEFAEADGNTLVIVTADHETGGFAVEGGSIGNFDVIGDFTTAKHTATMVPLFAYGPGSEVFTGIYDNTEIFHKMMKAYNFEAEKP
jgi:alkaline phosphatase